MADEAQILNGSYKGVPIAIDSNSIQGGRKSAIKPFPNRDTQTVEDLGLIPRKYSLEIVISDKSQQDYFAYRNRLLAVLESKGSGELIHPLYGRIDDVVAVSWNLNENFTSFGDSRISVNFEVNDNTGIPQSSSNVITEIVTANDVVQAAIVENISENFKVTENFTGNFSAAFDKVNSIIDRAKEATSYIGEQAQNLNEFVSDTNNFQDIINTLLPEPSALAGEIIGLFSNVNDLYESANATFNTLTGFFDFGIDDIEIKQDTAGRIERQTNNNVLNGAVASSSLGYTYLSVARTDFRTTREIDDLTSELDNQYAAVQNSESSQAVKDSITDMRVKVLQVLDEARVNASQIVNVETNPTTARILAFNYYGNDEQGSNIIDLNNYNDVSFIEGSAEMLTA